MLIKNANIVTIQNIFIGDLKITGGIITGIGQITPEPGEEIIDARNAYLLTGFIDLHTNGTAGFDTTHGMYEPGSDTFRSDEENYCNALTKALKYYAGTGATTVFLTSIAAPIEQLKKVYRYINNYSSESNRIIEKGIIGGIYNEGSFIKADEYKGAQNPEYFYNPSEKEIINEFLEASNDLLKIFNIVPEWNGDVYQLITKLRNDNKLVGIGHSGATADQFNEAVERGASLAIHFLNGPSYSSTKPFFGGGAVEAALKNSDVYLEIIPDGYHIDKAYVMDVIKRKGADKVIAVSDSMFVTGLDNIDEFEVSGVKGKVSNDGYYLERADKPRQLFGSNLTMLQAFENLLNWFTSDIEGTWNKMHSALKPEEALINASKLCSGNAAKLMNNKCGMNLVDEIKVGKNADLLLMQIIEKGDGYRCELQEVFKSGINVYEKIRI